jgi:protein phosphatase
MSPRVAALSLAIHGAGATEIGPVRKHNEDAVLLRGDLGLYVVADGAGGHNAGNVASALATTSIANFFENTQNETESLPEYDTFGLSTGARRLARAVQRANRDIIDIAKSSMRHRGMGTTVVAVWARPEIGAIHIGHVGDSRCYRYRAGQLEQLTHDHSLYNDVLELEPDLPDAAMARLPKNVVTRALGMEGVVRATVQSNALVPGDRYLLCSDGLSSSLGELDIAQALEGASSPDEAVRALIRRALEGHSEDNIAVLVLFCEVAASGRTQTAPFPPPRPPTARPITRHPAPARLTEGSSPEIVIVGMEYEVDDPTGIHIVPPESATEGLLSAIDSFVGPMRARGPGKSPPMCTFCGTPLTDDGLICPVCNAPQS